jgi:hypothetical protein
LAEETAAGSESRIRLLVRYSVEREGMKVPPEWKYEARGSAIRRERVGFGPRRAAKVSE